MLSIDFLEMVRVLIFQNVFDGEIKVVLVMSIFLKQLLMRWITAPIETSDFLVKDIIDVGWDLFHNL